MNTSKNPDKIQNMFDEIAEYYDSTNNYISFFMHNIIKTLAIRELNIKPRSIILDICCGTGDFSQIISKMYPRTKIIGLDFSKEMLKLAKIKNPKGVFIEGDCTKIPFKDNEFQYVTAGFGLRNVEDRKKAISEIYRILDYDGEFLHLDFGEKNNLSKIFNITVPIIAKLLHLDSEHYKYLISSKESFPTPDELIHEFEQQGFKCRKKVYFLFETISAQIMQK